MFSRFIKFTLLFICFSLSQQAQALVGSERAGKGWEAIVYMEFNFKQGLQKTVCTGFLINASQAITVGHCAIHDESNREAYSASVCIGKQRPFTKPGEGCFKTKRIRFAKSYQYNSPSDMVIVDLAEAIPLSFLGIKPVQLISATEAGKLFKTKQKSSSQLKIISFGSRNFNTPTLGKKGWVKANAVNWDSVSGLLKATSKGSVFGHADDGAGLLLKTSSGWKLAGLMLKATPDFFIAVQPFFDPCLPPEPSPRQPDIKLSSSFYFVSVNTLACSNKFLNKNLSNKKLCQKISSVAQQRVNSSSTSREKLRWLNQASNKGDAVAMLQLADKYIKGAELRKNPQRALELITKAAQKGYADAEYRVGLLLNNENNNFKPNVKGNWKQWFLKAAEQGHAAAQFEVAQYLKNNRGDAVYDWLMRSARQGYASAQYQLGYNYYYGHGIKRDSFVGSQWMEYAAGQGHLEASNFLKQHPKTVAIKY